METLEELTKGFCEALLGCAVTSTNIKLERHGLQGVGDIDVIGTNPEWNQVFMFQTTKHIKGCLYGDFKGTMDTINRQFDKMEKCCLKYKGWECNLIFVTLFPASKKIRIGIEQILRERREKNQFENVKYNLIWEDEFGHFIRLMMYQQQGTTHQTKSSPLETLQMLTYMRRTVDGKLCRDERFCITDNEFENVLHPWFKEVFNCIIEKKEMGGKMNYILETYPNK